MRMLTEAVGPFMPLRGLKPLRIALIRIYMGCLEKVCVDFRVFYKKKYPLPDPGETESQICLVSYIH